MVQKHSLPAWDDLEAILAVAKAKSIRKAADRLGVAHTTLARRIDAAEHRLGLKAFVRSTQGFALTPAGELMLAHISRMSDEADALARALAGGDTLPAGRVKVSLPPGVLTACVAPALPAFRQNFPEIDLDFDVRYSFLDLDRNEADIAVRYQAEPAQHLIGQRIGQSVERAYATLAVAARFLAGEKTALIGWSAGEAFVARARSLGLGGLPVGYTCVDVHAQIALAEAGLGIAILPSLAGGLSALLHPINKDASVITSPIWVLTHPDLARSARVRCVATFLADTLRAALKRGLMYQTHQPLHSGFS